MDGEEMGLVRHCGVIYKSGINMTEGFLRAGVIAAQLVFSGRVPLIRKRCHMTPKIQKFGIIEMWKRHPLPFTGLLSYACYSN
jgi:hypothetical protein